MRKTRKELNIQARDTVNKEVSKVLGFFTPSLLNEELQVEYAESIEALTAFLDNAQRQMADRIKVI